MRDEQPKNIKGTERDPLVLEDTTRSWSSQDSKVESAEQCLARARRLLYISHLFSQFSEIAWQFCLVLFLAAFTNYESLFLVSTFGLTGGIFLCLFGSWAGKYVDGTNRLIAAHRFIWTENLCVVTATIFCYMLLGIHPPVGDNQSGNGGGSHSAAPGVVISRYTGLPHDAKSILLLLGIHLLGATAQVLDRGFLVAIERDWVVVMSNFLTAQSSSNGISNGSDTAISPKKKWLTKTNVTMKQIDLSCKVVAPAVSGFIIGAFDNGKSAHRAYDLRGAAVLVGAINALALVVEYVCTARIYALVPELSHNAKKATPASNDIDGEKNITTNETRNGEENRDEAAAGASFKVGVPSCVSHLFSDELKTYLAQPVALGGIGLALLYLNVLTFGGIMTAYLVWRGMRLESVGTWRGISSAVGLMGTFVYHISAKYLTYESTGMWSICFQFCCISVSFFSLWIHNYDIFLILFIGGVCLSRVGLWVFDIAITQLMQERVASDCRGVVGGVQQSLNAFFGLFSFALGLVFPDPRQFFIYVGAGYLSVGVATILFFVGVFLPSRLSSHRNRYERVDST